MGTFDDFQPSGNIAVDPETYELENEAIERDGRLDAALAHLAPWAGRTLLDVGCGTGFWLPRYAATAGRVIGVEPDPPLRARAADRVAGLGNVEVVAGSAEHVPVPDDSVDVVHARFAYFYGEGGEAGLAEVRRVLRPAGVFAVVDNDWGWGEFAELLRQSTIGNAAIDPASTDAWWAAQGAARTNVEAGWTSTSPAELERILRLEFPADVVGNWLATRPSAPGLTYGVAVFTLTA